MRRVHSCYLLLGLCLCAGQGGQPRPPWKKLSTKPGAKENTLAFKKKHIASPHKANDRHAATGHARQSYLPLSSLAVGSSTALC